MKKVLAFCIVAIALVLTGCKKNKTEFNGFTINQGASMTLVQGESVRLSMSVQGQNVSPSYTFQSSDPLKVDVDSTGVVLGIDLTESPVYVTVTGTAVIDNNPITYTQVINVTVIDFAESLVFSEFQLMQPSEDWEKGKYVIYMKRRNRASEVPDGDDATVRKTKIEGNRYKVDSIFPAYNEWVHLYDTVIEGSNLQIGLFADSVTRYRAWFLSQNCFFDSEGAFQTTSQGAILETFFAFVQDSKYAYVLGDREFIDDLTALDTIRPTGVEAMPYPGYFQTGHFDEEQYLEFFTAVFNEEDPEMDDYTFWAPYDSKLKPVGLADDGEGGTYAYTLPFMGYPKAGGYINLASGTSDDVWLMADQYAFDALVHENPMIGYCLKLETKEDPETGEQYVGYANPLQMSDSTTVHYVKTAVSSAPIMKVNHTPERETMGAVRNSVIKTQMKINNTLGAIFRMAAMK